jgi:PAS domain S-box-containing protein
MSRKRSQRGLHMLVVDDNLVHRRMSHTILTAAGYGVTLAEGGPQALAAFEKSLPDVVLLDIRMPGMDGFEVCQRLRALPTGKRVPVLFLTDVSDLSSPDQAVSAGGDDFLNKPINRIELLVRVRSLLRARHHEAILERLLAEVREAVIVLDGRGLITKWSQQAASFFGWPAIEAVGKSLSQLLLSPERRQSFDEELTRYVNTGASAVVNERAESTAVHQSGRQFAIGLYVTAVHTANETAFCAFIRDASGPRSQPGV